MSIKNVIDKIRLFLESEKVSLTDVKTTDGTILSFDADALAVGVEIFVLDENGRTPAPDGEYVLEDGTKIKVTESKVEEIEAPEMPEPETETPEEMPVPEGEMPMEEVDAACKPKKLFEVSELTVDDLAEYPWEKCIADQKAAGYSEEVANKICGAIRSKNMNEELSIKVEQLQKDNGEIKSLLTQLADNLNEKSFKEEVKMEQLRKETSIINRNSNENEIKTIKNEGLNNILKNMYKK